MDDPDAIAHMTATGFDPAAAFRKAAEVAEALAPTLVGLAESDGKAAVDAQNCLYRVARRDGVSFGARADRRPNRINVTIENGTITAAEVY
jgi:hypothetical protein